MGSASGERKRGAQGCAEVGVGVVEEGGCARVSCEGECRTRQRISRTVTGCTQCLYLFLKWPPLQPWPRAHRHAPLDARCIRCGGVG